MDTLNITLTGIAVPSQRLRALRTNNVDMIAVSMDAQGQLHPIVVRQRDDGGYWLVAGRHRFEAAKKLKWKTIRCEVKEGVDDDQAELIEIDENLARAELTPAETAMHVARRQELYEKVHGKAKARGANAANKTMGRDASDTLADAFTTETAKKTGTSERQVQRDAARGKSVKVLAEVMGTCLDTGKELDALAKLPEAEQHALAERARAGERVSAIAKPPKPDVAKLIEYIGQPERILPITEVATIARAATEQERIALLTQLERLNAWINQAGAEIAIAGGANVGVLSPPSLRYQTLSFLRKAIERIEAELAGREPAQGPPVRQNPPDGPKVPGADTPP
jgi:hypothetical protein